MDDLIYEKMAPLVRLLHVLRPLRMSYKLELILELDDECRAT